MSGKTNTDEIRFLQELRRKRQSISSISSKINVPKSTLFDKMNRMEHEGIIMHKTLLDFAAAGFKSKIKVALKVPIAGRQEVLNWLCEHPNINNVYKVNHGYDFLFEAIFKDQKEASDFTDLLHEKFNIEDSHVFHVIEDIKREAFHRLTDES